MKPSLQTIEEQIRHEAYALHLARGGMPGHEQDDWLQAEQQVLLRHDERSQKQGQALAPTDEELVKAARPPQRATPRAQRTQGQ